MVWNNPGEGRAREIVPLSRAQKWDLTRMAAAAVLSTGVLLAVLVEFPAPADPISASVMDGVAARVPAPIIVVSAGVPAQVTAPALRLHVQKRATLRAPRRAQPALANSRPAPPATLSKKLARLVVGDGHYGIRPFPAAPERKR